MDIKKITLDEIEGLFTECACEHRYNSSFAEAKGLTLKEVRLIIELREILHSFFFVPKKSPPQRELNSSTLKGEDLKSFLK